jgi:hypothetical protein
LVLQYQEIEKLFLYLLNYSFLLPVFVSLTVWRKLKDYRRIKILVGYLLLFFCLNLYFDEIIKLLNRNNYYLAYTSIEYIVFAHLITSDIPNKLFKKAVTIASFLFITFLVSYFAIFNIERIDSIPIGIESILLFVYIFYYFFFILNSGNENTAAYESPLFWIVVGIFIYLAFTFFFNILGDSMEVELINSYYHLSYLGDICKNICFAVGIILIASKIKTAQVKNNKIPFLDIS